MKYICIILGFLLLNKNIFSQIFGGHKPSTKWGQINTDTARIIFQKDVESNAQKIAQIIHSLAKQNTNPLGNKLQKVNIVLQSKTTVSNGYAGLGPFRSEFYLTPPSTTFDQGSIPWATQLALHEYRHVQQFSQFNAGASHWVKKIFGEELYSVAINAAIPNWFYEGDAVYSETFSSEQGRGRLPYFLSKYNLLWQGGKEYSWMKTRNGSLKHFVPNHYDLGYLLVNYGYKKYGDSFWQQVTSYAASFKQPIYPFQKAVKKYTGLKYQNFIANALTQYKSTFDSLTSMHGKAVGQPYITNYSNYLTHYLFPFTIDEKTVLFEKVTARQRTTFFIKNESRITRLAIREISDEDQFSYKNGKLVYAAYESNPRWFWNDYSVLHIVDVFTGKKQTLKGNTKYFTPDISPSGQRIVAVENNEESKSKLTVIEIKSKKIVAQLQSQEIASFIDPKFLNEDSIVAAVRLLDGKMALAIADIATGSIKRILEPSYNVVGNICLKGDTIVYTAGYNGFDNVFACLRSTQEVFQLTNSLCGDYQAQLFGEKMYWSSRTASGSRLMEANIKNLLWKKMPSQALTQLRPIYSVANEAIKFRKHFADSIATKYKVQPYKASTNLFNFHSLRPYFQDAEYSLSLYGQNILNFLQTGIYYLYNQNEGSHAAGFDAVWGKWFPFLSIGSSYTFNRNAVLSNKLKQWNQADFYVGASIPLSWISQNTIKNFNLGTNLVSRQDGNYGLYKDSFKVHKYTYLSHSINWSQVVQTAVQHIFPRLGYSGSIQFRHAITQFKSWQYLAAAAFYLPGIATTHSLVLSAAVQQSDTSNVLFASRMVYARGFTQAYFSKMWRASANYHFPILYPDFGFVNILYLLRIRGNLFADYLSGYSKNGKKHINQTSSGIELYFDTKWWNEFPISFGFRLSKLFNDDIITKKRNAAFEIILPVSIIPR